MDKHQELINTVNENAAELGSALLMTQSDQQMAFVGTCNTPDLLDFIETMFRASPGTKALFEEALERSECPTS